MFARSKFALRLFALFFVSGLVIFSFLVFLKALTHVTYPDFVVYFEAGDVYLDGGNPYGMLVMTRDVFLYPPFALLFVSPFAFFELRHAQQIFGLLSVLSYFLSILILFRLTGLKVVSWMGGFIIFLLLNFFPEKFTVGMGQINNFLLLFLTLSFYFFAKKREGVSGIILSLPFLLKIFPLFCLPVVFIYCKWKMLWYFSISSILICVACMLFVDDRWILYYVHDVTEKLFVSVPGDYYNQSLSGMFARSFYLGLIPILLIKVFLLGFVYYFMAKDFFTNKDKNFLLSFSMGVTLSLILSPVTWQHHLVFVIIPFFILLSIVLRTKSIPLYLLTGVAYFLVSWNFRSVDYVHSLLLSHGAYGLLVLLGIQIYLLRQNKRAT